MSAWNETQAGHDADKVRGYPFSKEAERRLDLDRRVELEQRFDRLTARIGKIADDLEAVANTWCLPLADEYREVLGERAAEQIDSLTAAVPELSDLAEQVRAVRKAIET